MDFSRIFGLNLSLAGLFVNLGAAVFVDLWHCVEGQSLAVVVEAVDEGRSHIASVNLFLQHFFAQQSVIYAKRCLAGCVPSEHIVLCLGVGESGLQLG